MSEELERLVREADDRGRVNIGTDYADQRVRVAVVEVLDE